jgi:hypothetical protein
MPEPEDSLEIIRRYWEMDPQREDFEKEGIELWETPAVQLPL